MEQLVSPRLTDIEILHLWPRFSEILPLLIPQCPLLTRPLISIDWPKEKEVLDYIRTLSIFICGLQSICTLYFPVLDQVAFDHLGQLPTLMTLRLKTFIRRFSLAEIQ
jgi:hypothetical protein